MNRLAKGLSTLLVLALALCACLAVAITISYRTIPMHNTSLPRFDTIIVLGTPAKLDGTPSLEQRTRVLEGIREYRAGIAPHLIMTGGAAHNRFVEAHVMAQFARSQGVPADAITEEGQALNTIQNIYYSAEIMHEHHWHSAEVVSSPSHLPRASLILRAFDREHPELAIDWSTHPASWPPEYSRFRELVMYSAEAAYCFKLRLAGFPRSRFLPEG